MSRLIAAFIVSMAVGLLVGPLFIFLLKKIKARQHILSYVDQHKDKKGVPTMGGIIFLLATVLAYLLFREGQSKLSTVALVIFCAYGMVGLLDDGLKVIFKRNLGLKAYQKIISQAVIAALITYYCYTNEYIGSAIYIPFLKVYFDFSWWYLPLCFILFIAVTNAVNLTDGLDGLAGSVSVVYLFFVGLVILFLYNQKTDLGQTLLAQELYNLSVLCISCIGGILAFLWFNTNKASVFMGDTGSLALGGMCCVLPILIRNPLLIGFVGIIFVVSVISVIIQVVSFKTRKKRVLLMAPFHHHLEKKGYREPKIVAFYSIITFLFGALTIFIMI